MVKTKQTIPLRDIKIRQGWALLIASVFFAAPTVALALSAVLGRHVSDGQAAGAAVLLMFAIGIGGAGAALADQ